MKKNKDAPKKKRKRKPASPEVAAKRKETKLYFHSGTQDSIVKFQETEDPLEQDIIYTNEILPAFEKLTENLIFIHRFTSLHDSYEDLKNDCITFLYETLKKFDASRGTKAFSYFNVVAKNFLIIKSKQKTKAVKKNISLENKTYFSADEARAFQEFNYIESQEENLIKEVEKGMIFDIIDHLTGEARTDNEKMCIFAIKKLFESAHELEFLNKRAVFVYLREISGLTPKQLTTTISSLKKKYRGLKRSGKSHSRFAL